MNSVYDCDVIKQLSDDFVHQINFVFIDNGGKAVICVTNDDNVYAFGDNNYDSLGLGHSNAIDRLTKFDELCHKQVITFDGTLESLVALCKTGHIYTWGYNRYGQLGNGTIDETYICMKPVIINSLFGEFIIDIKCGDYHCLALTQNGEVFEWGWSVSGVHNTVPFKVRSGLELHTITAISCGKYHSLALTDNGDVFSWGMNDYGQCGTGCYDNQCIPVKVKMLSDIKIVKISCGVVYSVLLSDSGDIYQFGRNYGQQCDSNGRDNENTPMKLNVSNKFVDILSEHYGDIVTVGLSDDGFYYVWGNIDEQVIDKPRKTQFTGIDRVIAYITEFKCGIFHLKKMYENMSAIERLKQSFNKEEYSDIVFKINGKLIYAQKSHLKTVCAHFKAMFSDNVWLESNAKVIEITQYSYSVYYSFLKYLYTDSLIIQSKHLIELYYLADSYIEYHLKQKCIETMKNVTNISNVYLYYSFAVKNNLSNLENYLFDYMIPNMSDVVKTEAYLQLNDSATHQKFLIKAINNGYLVKNQK